MKLLKNNYCLFVFSLSNHRPDLPHVDVDCFLRYTAVESQHCIFFDEARRRPRKDASQWLRCDGPRVWHRWADDEG